MSKGPALTQAQRRLVFERDAWRCRRCGLSSPLTIHHRRPRSMGGTRRIEINGYDNLVTLCGSGTTGCHGWVEKNRRIAYALGWLVPSWADPTSWPIRLAEGVWAQPREGHWNRLVSGTEWQETELREIGGQDARQR